jgi:prophage regulatory protein
MERNVKLLREPQARALVCRAKTQLWDDIKRGVLTPPVRIGRRSVAWPEYELQAVNAARIAGRSEEQIKALVARLVKERVQLDRAVAA